LRDNQRKRLYRAEKVLGFDVFQDITEVRDYLARLYQQDWFKRVYPNARMPRVVQTWGSYHSMAGLTMRLLPHPERWVVLHELAHSLAGSSEVHGPKFAGVFLWLIKNAMGHEEYTKLKRSFREKRVKVNEIVEPVKYEWDGATLMKDGVKVDNPLSEVLAPEFTDVDLARQIVATVVNRSSEQDKE
jgi:hypothetical protein